LTLLSTLLTAQKSKFKPNVKIVFYFSDTLNFFSVTAAIDWVEKSWKAAVKPKNNRGQPTCRFWSSKRPHSLHPRYAWPCGSECPLLLFSWCFRVGSLAYRKPPSLESRASFKSARFYYYISFSYFWWLSESDGFDKLLGSK